MSVRKALLVLFLSPVLSVSGANPALVALPDDSLCIGNVDRVSASEGSCRRVASRESARGVYADDDSLDAPYIRHAGGATELARLRGGQLTSAPMREVAFTVIGLGKSWPAQATIELTDGKSTWQWTLSKTQVRRRQVLRLLPADYRLSITAPAHQSVVRQVNVAEEGPSTDIGTVTLPAMRTVSGTVVGRRVRPVAGCAVLADGVALGFTDARGRFAVELPVPAPESLVLRHPEYAPRLVSIAQGTDTTIGTVELVRGGSILCTVDRQKLKEAKPLTVELFQFLPADKFRQRHSSALPAGESVVQFQQLDPGDYGILLKGSEAFEQLVVLVSVDDESEREIHVTIDPLRMYLTAIYGDEPLSDATIRLVNSGTLGKRVWVPEVKLDSGGSATVDLWQRGSMWAEVRSEELAATFVTDRRTFSDSENTTFWDIVVPERSVTGIVRDAATAEPVQGARVIHESDAISGEVRVTDQQGRFRYDALDDGRHSFRVDSGAHLPSQPQSVDFAGGASGERNLEFRLDKGKAVPLEVRNADGAPAASAIVIDGCTIQSDAFRFFRTDDQGRLALPTAGGRHSLCVVPVQGSFALVQVDPTQIVDQAPIQVRVPAPLVTVRVRARTPEGVPVAHLAFLLVYNGQVVPPMVPNTLADLQHRPRRTDDRGELMWTAMPAGQYEIWAYTSDEEAVSIAAGRLSGEPVYRGPIGPGESTLDLVIERKR
jgi:hypothetical protein